MLFGIKRGRTIRNRLTGRCFNLNDIVHAAGIAKANYVTARIGVYEDENFVNSDMMQRNIVTGELAVSNATYFVYKRHKDSRILSMAFNLNALDELYKEAGAALKAAEINLEQKELHVRYELETRKRMKRLGIL